jgi:hypothetical protein
VTANGVKVLGYRNWPGRISVAASTLYAKNLLTFLTTFWDKEAGAPKLPEDDAIVKGVMLTRGGAVVHANFAPDTPPQAATPEPGGAHHAGAAIEGTAEMAPEPPEEMIGADRTTTEGEPAPEESSLASVPDVVAAPPAQIDDGAATDAQPVVAAAPQPPDSSAETSSGEPTMVGSAGGALPDTVSESAGEDGTTSPKAAAEARDRRRGSRQNRVNQRPMNNPGIGPGRGPTTGEDQ